MSALDLLDITDLAPSDRQQLRRLISSFRHSSRRAPWDDVEWRAYQAADRLDRADDRRLLIAQAAALPAFDAEEEAEADHARAVWLAQREVARSIYHGGA